MSLFKPNFQIIFNWHEQNLICACCGTNKSVKYKHTNNNNYCDICITQVEYDIKY